MRGLLILLGWCLTHGWASAGIYLDAMPLQPLPAEWRGFLLDHRALRDVAQPRFRVGERPSPLRDKLADAALQLEAQGRSRSLTPDETAQLGGLYLRLGKSDLAVSLLRPAARLHPTHFLLQAHLAATWQGLGDWDQAILTQAEAVRFAPQPNKEVEEYQLKLLRLRQQEGRTAQNASAVDDLFGVRYVGTSGQPEAGTLAATQKKKLPPNAVAILQQLALGFPADGRLLWQLGELANATGDVRMAANILDGCVTDFGMKSQDLRNRRAVYRAAWAERAQSETHTLHQGTLRFASRRALAGTFDATRLPPIREQGLNVLPWAALSETEIGPGFRPQFLKYVAQLDGRRVTLAGYMTPSAGSETELTAFLLTEYPIGCWFCESPSPLQMVSVELPSQISTQFQRQVVKVSGILRLNRTEPERFLFTIENATVGPAD
ncbi:MAG: DUF3299 domain-containing protein [Bacteroidales bacterium]|nr:DUF3299 domain-containing protein [Bacteroidales bacterium]